jgi:hypothetical protein
MDAIGGHHGKWSKPDSETQNPRFLSYVEDSSNDKHIYKNKHGHTQTQMYNMLLVVEVLYGTQGKKERKREW